MLRKIKRRFYGVIFFIDQEINKFTDTEVIGRFSHKLKQWDNVTKKMIQLIYSLSITVLFGADPARVARRWIAKDGRTVSS